MIKKSIIYENGFADSNIESYHSENNNLIIFLNSWEEKLLKFEFIECVLFLVLNSWDISDVCEADNPILLERALKKVYEIIPKNHPYKLFQFLDIDDDPAVEIVSKDIVISTEDSMPRF